MGTRSRILVVDDEQGMLEVFQDTLSKISGADVIAEISAPRAAERLARESFDLLISDVRMPKVDGTRLLKIAHENDPDMPVLMVTAFPSIESAVESMKLGATDYITKPFLPDDMLQTVRRLLSARQLLQENALLERQVERPYAFSEIVGSSPAMQRVFEAIEKTSKVDVDVLIVGETGTGKELVARGIHRLSARAARRFVPIDCGAVPENLIESEFFGHERGAFTGANARSLGLLEFADQGTLFLDEIGELPAALQVKLLRALQERRFRHVGGKEEIGVDVRVVAATNRNLDHEVRAGRFREDLYYRINVVRIDLPPLRDRGDDIRSLVEHFLGRYAGEMKRAPVEADPEVMEVLSRYPWPGNVRELQNALKRALAMGTSARLTLSDLPDEIVISADIGSEGAESGFFSLRAQRVDAFEREYFTQLLRTHCGDVSQAAREARLPRGTLYRLLKKRGIDPDEFRS